MLTREEILRAAQLRREVVACPKLGGEVLLVELSGRDGDTLDQFERHLSETAKAADAKAKRPHLGRPHVSARLVAWCLRGPADAELFVVRDARGLVDAVATEAGVEQLSAAVGQEELDRLWSVAARLCGRGVGSIEAAAGNSQGTPSSGRDGLSPSPSGSPAPASSPSS